MAQRKNPVLAGWLNLIPGVGLMYAGRWLLGIITFIAMPVAILVYIFLGNFVLGMLSSLLPPQYAAIGIAVLGVVIFIATWRGLYFDGYRAAQKYNQRDELEHTVPPAQKP